MGIFKRIYRLLTVTAVTAVLALLAFGVGLYGRPMLGKITLETMADKIGAFFVGIDFPDSLIDSEDTNDKKHPDGLLPPSLDKPDDGGSTGVIPPSTDVGATPKDIYDFDYSAVPEGHTPIIPMDLSLSSYGAYYINNSTGYSPDAKALLKRPLGSNGGYEYLSAGNKPLVLIVHTHGTEAYSADGAISCPEDQADHARSDDTSRNVVEIGRTVAERLNKKGIPTAHCTIMHDSIQYKDSYARAEETIRKYLEQYPSIKLVIDLHRDAVIRSSGEIVRPVTALDGKAAAQLMCVVGSDWGGQRCDNWEDNLSLALKLREALNKECPNLCRPVDLRASTYNQELSPYSLLVEVGASGNSLTEALRSAQILADTVAELVKQL